ncbi:MAG: carboxypeptidase regulatory-like domain-containing protein [Candidatus Kerfeldbacteria bacterium]
MKKSLIALAVCGVFAIAAPALAADGTISGTVTHASDGTPINGISVTATNVDTGTVSGGSTDVNGAYSFTAAPGTYDLTHYTYTSSETNTYFIKKATTTITVASGETKSGQNFSLTRRGKFIGHVYASDGVTPISGATLTISNISGNSSGYAYASTPSTGSYTGIPVNGDNTLSAVGSYTFIVTKLGYFSASVTGVILTGDETSVTQDIRLTPASIVSGTITDANGAAISGATVTLSKSTTGTSYSSVSNASGAYAVSVYDTYPFNGSAIAEYPVTVVKAGYVTKTATIAVVTESSTLSGNNFALVTAGTMTGTVTNSAGGALSGATISADDGFGTVTTATSDGSGAYSLTSLKPSTRYILTVTKTYYVGQKAYGITVTGGATTSGLNFALPDARTFSGAVLAKATNAPLDGAVVYLYKRNKARTEVSDFSFTIKSDGSFNFRSVSPGKYRVKVVKSGYISIVLDSVNLSSSVSGTIYKMDLASIISGRITTGKNVGVASADIGVFSEKNGREVVYSTTTSDENGYYFVSGLKKGTYRLRVMGADYVTQVVKVTVKTGVQATKNIKLAVAGSISGYITDKSTGLPIGSALVRVVGTSIVVSSDSNGFYVLDGIAPGQRKITVVNAYYDLPGQKTVKVSAGKTKTGISFALNQKK